MNAPQAGAYYTIQDVPAHTTLIAPHKQEFSKARRTPKARLIRILIALLILAGLATLVTYFALHRPPSRAIDPNTIIPTVNNFTYRDLSQSFQYGVEPIRGVNLGGWLVTEPFLNPSLYGKVKNAVDEWTLSLGLGASLPAEMEKHYETYITEDDFVRIAQMGLNHIRIPIPHWIIQKDDSEPFYGGGWKWLLRALSWARKYGLRVALDLHTVPGSQSGYQHSGRRDVIGFLKGGNGTVHAQRALEIVKKITQEFFAGNRVGSDGTSYDHVTIFSVLNEPAVAKENHEGLRQWYIQAYNNVRTGSSSQVPFKASISNTPHPVAWPAVVVSDGFEGENKWYNAFPPSEGYAGLWMDTHKYVSLDPESDALPKPTKFSFPCGLWRTTFTEIQQNVGPVYLGEWSAQWSAKAETDHNKISRSDVEDLAIFTQLQMDMAEKAGLGWFFWNLKTEGNVYAQWDYYVGVMKGWIPREGRTYTCPDGGKGDYCAGGECFWANGTRV